MENKRKHIRFAPDPETMAFITKDGEGNKLKFPIPCLVVEESAGGCGLVAKLDDIIRKGVVLTVKVGHLQELPAEVRWTKVFGGKISYFGLEYKA